METVFTNEKDERFLKLVEELDYGYYKRIGNELKNMNITMSSIILIL